MKGQSRYYKQAIYFVLVAIIVSMTAYKSLSKETKPELGTTLTVEKQEPAKESAPSFGAPACSRDLSKDKLLGMQDSTCIACHKECVDRRHCKKFKDTWKTTDCLRCHEPDSIK